MLQIIGLDGEAERVYNVLLSARPATDREIAAATGLSPSVVRAALRLLHSHGLVGPASGQPDAYVAVDPAIALDVLLLNQEERLRKARARAQEAGERFRQAALPPRPGQSEPGRARPPAPGWSCPRRVRSRFHRRAGPARAARGLSRR